MNCACLSFVLLAKVLIFASVSPSILAFNGMMRTIRTDQGRLIRVEDMAEQLGLEATGGPGRLELRKDGRTLTIFPKKRAADLDGIVYYLNFEPFLDGNNVWYLHRCELEKSLIPIFAPEKLTRFRLQTVLIDPGHGGSDSGALGSRLVEKELNLKLAGMIAEKLRSIGFAVAMTRTDDRFVSLAERPEEISRTNADLFLSIHQNASPTGLATGIETFVMAPVGTAASNDDVRRTGERRYYGNRFDALSIRLADQLQRRLIRATGAFDRGVKRARFQVLRLADCPAVLIEFGFINHRPDEEKLGDDRYLETLAGAVVDGIVAFSREGDL